MILLAVILWIAGLGLLMRHMLSGEERRTQSELRFASLSDEEGFGESEDLKRMQQDLKLSRVTKFSMTLRNRGFFDRRDVSEFLTTLDRELTLAGRPQGWTAPEALAWVIMFWAVSLTTLVLLTVAGLLPSGVFVLCTFVSLIYPPLKLRQLKKIRQDNAKSELPYLLQELRLNLSGGFATLDDALGRTVSRALTEGSDSVLIREFAQAYAEYRHGQKPREEALFDAARRLGVQSVEDFVQSLIQGLHTGSPIGDILNSQGVMVSNVYKQDMRQYIQGKQTSFIISVVFVMMGVVMFIGGPIFLTVMETFKAA